MSDTTKSLVQIQADFADGRPQGTYTPSMVRDLAQTAQFWGAPVVANAAARDALFPTPVGNEKVRNLGTRQDERYDASVGAWVPDLITRITPQLFGAKANGKMLADGAMTNGSPVLNSLTAGFVVGDIGKVIDVPGAGVAGATLSGTILGVVDSQNATLSVSASSTVTAKAFSYGTDDSVAILAAVNAAAAAFSGSSFNRNEVYFPPGIYIVSQNAVFTPTLATSLLGIKFCGAGWFTSIIRYVGLSSATWLYDNGATARTLSSTFEDLGFEGCATAAITNDLDIPSNAKGFKLTSSSWEQGFRFKLCRFENFDVNFEFDGSNNDSEIKFFGCRIKNTRSTVYVVNNVQSFNHEFYGCDVETVYGDVFSVPGGGGAIKIYGGSWIMKSNAGATDTYFFKATASTGQGALPYIFSGMRFELRGNNTNLVSIASTFQYNLLFDGCLFEGQSTADNTNWCKIAGYSTVTFRDSAFYEFGAGQLKFVAASPNQYGQAGTITFDHCMLPIDWSDRCSVLTFYGRIRAYGCYGSNVGAQTAGNHWAHDFDSRWDSPTPGQVATWPGTSAGIQSHSSPSDNQLVLKTAQMKVGSETWPTALESVLKLPKNAVIVGIHLRKPASSADATATTMIVTRNDKTGVAHLISNNAAMNATHSGDLDNYYYHVGSTTNERTLRLYSSAVTSGLVQGGMCIVQYY